MTRLPPLDMHAHIDPSIGEDDLFELGAVVFAVSRSLDEAATALSRHDETTVWGVGCHPGLVQAHRDFAADRFGALLDSTAFAGELGLDGRSRVSLDVQINTLRRAFEVLAQKPRIVSLHSYAATDTLVDELERVQMPGRVLHWWLGDTHLTRRAVEIGCYFSVPPSAARRSELLDEIPLDRVLTETDHPFGDKRSSGAARPGNVAAVERAVAAHHRIDIDELRRTVWRNLDRLTKEVDCGRLLPTRIRTLLGTMPG